MSKEQTKMQRLIAYLKTEKSIDPLSALRKFGIYRLGARIHNLRHKYDWDIRTEMKPTPLGEEHAVYHVVSVGKDPKQIKPKRK